LNPDKIGLDGLNITRMILRPGVCYYTQQWKYLV
jgi:hypothetical protein